jgi:hypothetical protein
VLNEKKKKLADQGEMFKAALKEAEQRVADAAAGSAGGGGGGRSTPPVESDDSESDGDDSWVQPTQARPAPLPPAAPAAEPRRGVKKEEASGSGAHAARAVPMATASQQKRAPAVRGQHAQSGCSGGLALLSRMRACEPHALCLLRNHRAAAKRRSCLHWTPFRITRAWRRTTTRTSERRQRDGADRAHA